MPNPTLSEQDRAKLDGIVSKMQANKESDDNIRFVVNDFKEKYGSKDNSEKKNGSGGLVDHLKTAKQPAIEEPLQKDALPQSSQQKKPSTNDLISNGIDEIEDPIGYQLAALGNKKSELINKNLKQDNLRLPIARVLPTENGKHTLVFPGEEEINDINKNIVAIQKDAFSNVNDAKSYLSGKLSQKGAKLLPKNKDVLNPDATVGAGDNIENYDLESVKANLDPRNATEQIAYDRLAKDTHINDALAGSADLNEAAIKFQSLQNPVFKKQLEAVQKGGEQLPQTYLGQLSAEFLSDPDVARHFSHLGPDGKTPVYDVMYRNAIHNLYQTYPEYGKKVVAQKVSQERESTGMNNPIVNIPTQESTDKLVDKMVKDGKLTPEEQVIYQKEITPELGVGKSIKRGVGRFFLGGYVDKSPIETPGALENFQNSEINSIKGIKHSVEDFIGASTLGAIKPESDAERTAGSLKDDYDAVNINAHSFGNTIGQTIGRTTGSLVPLVAGGIIAKVVEAPAAITEAINMALNFEGNNKDQSLKMFPGQPVKQKMYTALATGGDMFLGRLLPTGKIAEGVSNSLKDETAKVITEFTDGNITEAAARKTLLDKASEVANYAGKIAKGNIHTAGVMAAFGAYHDGLDVAFGGRDVSLTDIGTHAIESFASGLIGSTGLSALAANTGNAKLNGKMIMSIAENQDHYSQVVKDQAALNPELQPQVLDKLHNIQQASEIKKDLDNTDLSDKQKEKYLLQALSQKAWERKAESTTDEVIKKAYLEKAKENEKNKVAIFKGEDKAPEHENYNTGTLTEETPDETIINQKSEDEKEKTGKETDAQKGNVNESGAAKQPVPDFTGLSHVQSAGELLKMGAINEDKHTELVKDLTGEDETKKETAGEEVKKLKEDAVNNAVAEPTVQSAVIEINGKQYEGKNHAEAIQAAKDAGEDVSQIDRKADGKFKLSDGTIISREEAKNKFGSENSEQLIPQDESAKAADKEFEKEKPLSEEEQSAKVADENDKKLLEKKTEDAKDDKATTGAKELVEPFVGKNGLTGMDAEQSLKFIAEQSQNISPTGDELKYDNEKSMRDKYGDELVDAAISLYPKEKLIKSEKDSDIPKPIKSEKEQEDSKEIPPVEPPKEPLDLEGLPPEKQWSAIRKSKLNEIEDVKKMFDTAERKKWSGIIESAMTELQERHPDKNLYDAARTQINHFANLHDKNVSFNPTTEDLAVAHYFKAETEKRIDNIRGWDSEDEIQRMAAMSEFTSLNNDLVNVSKAINPSEAGRAFGFRQSEMNLDPDYGLKIRRMQLLDAKGGEKLSDADLEFTADQWQKERELMLKEAELKAQGMQESFDRQMEKLQKDYEDKLKAVKKENKEPAKEQKQKTLLSQSGKEFADKLRSGKLKGTYATFPGLPQTVNFVIEAIAQIVEKGSTLAEAISQYVKDNNIKDEAHFSENFFNAIDNKEKRESSFDKIKENAESNKVSGITNDMVGKNLIRDYVNSHIGEIDKKDILQTATEGLKEIFPDLTKEKLTEAYLKDGEFKIPTKKKLESDYTSTKRNLEKLAKVEKDLNDLKEKKQQFKSPNTTSSEREVDKDISKKEKELKKALNDAGIKSSNEDKYAKASYKSRAESHNQRIDDLSNKIQDKINNNLSPESVKALEKLKSQLESAKVVLDDNSKLSHAPVLEHGENILKKVQAEFDRQIKPDNIVHLGEIRRALQRAVDKFGTDKNESEQNIKLARAKDSYRRDIDEYTRKINAGEYEDHPIVELKKTDAEMIRLERDKAYIRGLYKQKQKEYHKDGVSNRKKVLQFARGVFVTWLIGGPVTLAKVASSAVIRPNTEAFTKLTFGNIFTLAFPEIAQEAKLGGESSTWQSVGKGYEAYLRQYSPKQLEDRYNKANDKYEKSDAEFQKQRGIVDAIPDKDSKEFKKENDKLTKLSNDRKHDLINAVGSSVYQYISGSSLREGVEVFLHRTAQVEQMFGEFQREGWDKQKGLSLDNINYVLNFVGRSHSAAKTFSGRFSFAAGFIARLEGAVNDGVDITKPDKLLEVANEAYADWDRGKYQQSNALSDGFNKIINAVDKLEWNGKKYGSTLSELIRADVAVTRVPVNMMHEAVLEYSLGAFTSAYDIAKLYYKSAKGIELKDEFGQDQREQFREQLRENIKELGADKAASIFRAFRKGGFGLGLLSLLAHSFLQYGGFSHRGQSKEDKEKKSRNKFYKNDNELLTNELRIGGDKVPEMVTKIIEHAPQLSSVFFWLNTKAVYQNQIDNGITTPGAAADAIMSNLTHIVDGLPVLSKTYNPIQGVQNVAKGAFGKVAEWNDVDVHGNLIKRKAFRAQDYLNILPWYGNKKDILSDTYYKQAAEVDKSWNQKIASVEDDANLSDSEKDNQVKALRDEQKIKIDEIYSKNKNKPE